MTRVYKLGFYDSAMGIGISLLGDMQSGTLMVIVASNMVVLLHLIANATENFVSDMGRSPAARKSTDERREFEATRLRLEVFWTIALIAATAMALKLVLPADLADQIIAAWFVGQGFALQPYVQSFLSGISLRGNDTVWPKIFAKETVVIDKDSVHYVLHDFTAFSVTLGTTTKYGTVCRVLSWKELSHCQVGPVAPKMINTS